MSAEALAAERARADRAEAENRKRHDEATNLMNALDEAEARVKVLEAALQEWADEPCSYGDGCPDNAGTRHGRCMWCKARKVLEAK